MALKSTKQKPKAAVSETLKRNWLRIKAASIRNIAAFNSTISMINKKDTEELYSIAKFAAYNTDYARLVFQNPQLRELIKNQEDAFTLNLVYQALSFKLNKREPIPAVNRIYAGFAGGIGRFGQK